MIDSYYTPPELAEKLASHVKEIGVQSIADFCIGEGELVKKVLPLFPDAAVYGVDISEEAISSLQTQYKNWHLGVCDFLDEIAAGSIPFLDSSEFDLIIMNPPFTCKGSTVHSIDMGGKCFSVSTAMLFLLRSLTYLSKRGGLYAIMPISCVHSQKDREAWFFLTRNYNACVLEEPQKISFGGRCTPNIVFVYAGNHSIEKKPQDAGVFPDSNLVVKVERGKIGMQNLVFSDAKEAVRLIHTTDLQDGMLRGDRKILAKQTVTGPGVLIPRVGNPKQEKVVVLNENEEVVLSDCVILLHTRSKKDAKALKSLILSNWSAIEQLYKGTGARYTTLSRLHDYFGSNI